ncbi:MAG: transketolase C-terminal domain-containing protein, partial [Chitinophagales bacterium]
VCSVFPYVVTVEDHVISGGFGSAVLECMAKKKLLNIQVKVHGVPDEFVEHGSPAELAAMVKLDAPGIASVVKEFFRQKPENSKVEMLA